MKKPKINITQHGIEFDIPLFFMKQGDQILVYTPVLDLVTSGDNKEQAISNFKEATEIFFNDIRERGVIDEVLSELGWELEEAQWQPPAWELSEMTKLSFHSSAIN